MAPSPTATDTTVTGSRAFTSNTRPAMKRVRSHEAIRPPARPTAENILGHETRIHLLKRPEAPDHEGRAGEEHQRQGDLRRHQDVPCPSCRGAAHGAALPPLRSALVAAPFLSLARGMAPKASVTRITMKPVNKRMGR